MLVAPVVDAQTKELIGVLQLINTLSGEPFPQAMEEGVGLLCETLAIALRQRQQRPMLAAIKGKYDGLVANAVTSAEELENAARSARRKNLDIETVLIDEYHVKPSAIGESLAAYFGVPYEPFKPDRVKPFELLKNLNREFLESSAWVPIDDTKDGMVVLTTDPEKLRGSHVVNNVYPKGKITYRVCCNHEFTKTLDQMFGVTHGAMDRESIGDLLSDMQEDAAGDEALEDMKSAAADNEVVKLVNKIIVDAYQQGASDIHVEPYPGKGKTEIRFRKDGMLQPYISVPHGYRNAIAARIKIMCDLDISERRKPQDGKIQFKKFGPLDIELRVASMPSQGGARGHRDADPRRRRADADRQARAVQAQPRPVQGRHREAVRSLLRLRSHGLRQDHDAAFGAGATSTRRPRRSGPPKTRWKSPSAACARCR